MIQVGNRVRSHDTSGKQGEITRNKWERGWNHMAMKEGISYDTNGTEGGII